MTNMLNPLAIVDSKSKDSIENYEKMKDDLSLNKKVLTSEPNNNSNEENILCCCCIYISMCIGLNIMETT
jgi:hypothetical protein